MDKSFINYTGGKYRLLSQLQPYFPQTVTNFIDLFSGSCVVGLNARNYFFNDQHPNLFLYDINEPLVELLQWVQNENINEIIENVNKIILEYNLTDTFTYGYSYYNVDSSTGLADLNREGFNRLRETYNLNPSPLYLYVLIIFAFNNQLRFNKNGMFNTPVGKRDFNIHMRNKLINFSRSIKQPNIHIRQVDFRDVAYLDNSFYYVDPPYLISTATYNESGGWTSNDEHDLLDYLDNINANGGLFALSNVLRHNNKHNSILEEWSANYNVHHLNINYNNSNYQKRGNNFSDEVLITNY